MWVVLALLGAAMATKPVPTIDSAAFLAGHWRTEAGAEEVWTTAARGVMVGAGRMPTAEGVTTEALRIETRDDGVYYVASPSGQATTAFRLTGAGPGDRVVFENPTHDFPQRITYWVPDAGGLAARVEARDGDGWRGFELRWARVATP